MDNRLFSYGIVSSADLVALQEKANTDARKSEERAGLSALTYDTAFDDAHEALVGLTQDLAGATERRSLKEMLVHKDRLRGLGILLIALALVGLFVDYVMAPSPP